LVAWITTEGMITGVDSSLFPAKDERQEIRMPRTVIVKKYFTLPVAIF
jgi:hypothetical protein